MVSEKELSKEDFLLMAQAAGLDISDSRHMDELYPYLRAALAGLQSINDLDLTGVEPAGVYIPPEE